jgi:hypothetical protein
VVVQLALELALPLLAAAGQVPPPGAATAGTAMDLLDENAAPAVTFTVSTLFAEGVV